MSDFFLPAPLGIGYLHASSLFVAFMVGAMLTGIGVAAARIGSRGSNVRVWTFVYWGVLVYAFLLFFSSIVDGLFMHPLLFASWLSPLGVAGLLSGLIVLSQGRHLWDARRADEERRMFAQDL